MRSLVLSLAAVSVVAGCFVACGTGSSSDGGAVDTVFDAGTTSSDASTPRSDAGGGDTGKDAAPPTPTYGISVKVTGYAGLDTSAFDAGTPDAAAPPTPPAAAGLVLTDNGGDDLAVTANGTFTFAKKIASGAAFDVAVKTQPGFPKQECTVSGGKGTVASGDVTSIAVTCNPDDFTIGGTVTGLSGAGLVLVSGGQQVAVNANGSFAFPTPVASGTGYDVRVLSQPTSPWQTCAVTSGRGYVAGANVTSVAVACTTNTYKVGGTLTLGSAGTVVLRDNDGDDLTLNASGAFTFATKVASGSPYAVTVYQKPAGWSCTLTKASGTMANADVSDVTVSCGNGVNAFGEFRKAMKCADFVNNGNNTQQWCFTLKGKVLCLGAWANDGSCADTANGIKLKTSTTINWPLRFNPNVDSCVNYNPNAAYVQNLANALGYASYTINNVHSGNSCPLSWLDANGDYQTDPNSGNSGLSEIYDIDFF